MSLRGRRQRGVWLPWERRPLSLRSLFGSRRWGLWIGFCVLGVISWAAWERAEHIARVRTTRVAIAQTRQALEAFHADMQRCPRSMGELLHPLQSGAHYLDEPPVDGWKRPLFVRCPGHTQPDAADIISAGESGSLWVDDNIH